LLEDKGKIPIAGIGFAAATAARVRQIKLLIFAFGVSKFTISPKGKSFPQMA
jgi:hypothetical protein